MAFDVKRALIGAGLGTVAAPGIGTVIGGLIGGLTGTTPSQDEIDQIIQHQTIPPDPTPGQGGLPPPRPPPPSPDSNPLATIGGILGAGAVVAKVGAVIPAAAAAIPAGALLPIALILYVDYKL